MSAKKVKHLLIVVAFVFSAAPKSSGVYDAYRSLTPMVIPVRPFYEAAAPVAAPEKEIKKRVPTGDSLFYIFTRNRPWRSQ